MNLLKGFGGGGGMGAMGGSAAKPLGAKQSYFSNIKLQDEPKAQEKTKSKVDRKKGPPKDFVPNKFALSFDPPCISNIYLTTQYLNTETQRTTNSIITKWE